MILRQPAMHVATIKSRHKKKTYTSHLLRQTYREDGQVKHRTLANLSHLPAELIDLIRRKLRGERVGVLTDSFDIVRTRPHGHVVATLGTLQRIGLDRIIASRRDRNRDLVVAMITARIIEPRSKLATARGLRSDTLQSTLGEILGLEEATEDDLYDAMDWIVERQERIENVLAKRHLEDGSLILYDVTSSYFEGRHCPLAKFGHPRDGKKDKLQIVYGLLCSSDGCPVAVEVFDGNTGDPKTLSSQIKKIKVRFGIKHVVFVGDRGMITDARIREDLEPEEDLDWITALRAPAIRKLMDDGAIDRSLFDERDMAEITSPDFPGERLVVCRNPLLAEERGRKREELLQVTERQIEKIVQATKRKKRPLRGKDKIALRLGKVIGRRKMEKHFKIEITETSLEYHRKEESIKEEKKLDGFYVIRTSLPAKSISAAAAVRAYKSLARVERAFRSLKTVDLKVRPIYHRLEKRVRAHVFLCMLAYYVEWHMRRALKPLLFDDHIGPKRQRSPVKPARRSDAAEAKAFTKETDDGTPVESFQTALMNLATIAKNRIRPKADGAQVFDIVTQPTELQAKMLRLLGVTSML